MSDTPISCTIMRGGTSKGLVFHVDALPADTATRDAVLLAAMGSPDLRQIDGLGGAHPLTSKVAVVGPSTHPDADVDYLFLQVTVDQAKVSDKQNCGNMLSCVGPWAIENGLHPAHDGQTSVRIHMRNTGSIAVATVTTPGGQVSYQGDARIDGVPGSSAPVPIEFLDVAGSSCGALLPTGNAQDVVNGIAVTCIDNGMPVILMRASDFGKTAYESPADLEADTNLKEKVEAIRLAMGEAMQLGDVRDKTVPKMCLIAPPKEGGAICTRNFIPHRVHEAIGVFGAVSVATACVVPGSVAQGVAQLGSNVSNGQEINLDVEHPTGFFSVSMQLSIDGDRVEVERAALLRTTRKLMQGDVFVGSSIWHGNKHSGSQ